LQDTNSQFFAQTFSKVRKLCPISFVNFTIFPNCVPNNFPVSENHVPITNKFGKSGTKFKDVPIFSHSNNFEFIEGQNVVNLCPIFSEKWIIISHFFGSQIRVKSRNRIEMCYFVNVSRIVVLPDRVVFLICFGVALLR